MPKCCSNSPKSEPANVAASETPAEQPTLRSGEKECCDDRSAKNEKRGCGCDC
jgi:hypothetical protein